jgi:hypothetical protein
MKTDRRVEIAKHIIEHGGCVGVDCNGRGGTFDGVPCPLRHEFCCEENVAIRARDFLARTKN